MPVLAPAFCGVLSKCFEWFKIKAKGSISISNNNNITGEKGWAFLLGGPFFSLEEGGHSTTAGGVGVFSPRSVVISLRRIMTRVIPLRTEMTHGSFCKGGSFLCILPAVRI